MLNPKLLVLILAFAATQNVWAASPEDKLPAGDPCAETFFGSNVSEAATVSDFAKIRALPATEREKILVEGLGEIREFRFLESYAAKNKLRVWLMGGHATSYGLFRINVLRARSGLIPHHSYYDRPTFMDIFGSSQDFDIAIDSADPEKEIGTTEASQLQSEIESRFPYKRGKSTAWEIRLLRGTHAHKAPLLDDGDFLKAHNDSLSTAMIELTTPPEGQHRFLEIRELDAKWIDKGPQSFEDIWDSRITYFYSDKHEKSDRAILGKNPAVFSVIRVLTKLFRDNLTASKHDLAQIRDVVAHFDHTDLKSEYAVRWLSWAPKKMMQSARDLERAVGFMDSIGLRDKLLSLSNPKVRAAALGTFVQFQKDLIDAAEEAKEQEENNAKKAGKNSVAVRVFTGLVGTKVDSDNYLKYLKRVTDTSNPDSMVSWLRREPLRTYPLGELSGIKRNRILKDTSTDPRFELLGQVKIGESAQTQGLKKVYRRIDLNRYYEFEQLLHAAPGVANVLLDTPMNGAGDYFELQTYRTTLQPHPSNIAEVWVEFDVEPAAREGVDFVRYGDHIGFVNKAALHPVHESLQWPIDPYIAAGNAIPAGTDEGYWRRYEAQVMSRIADMSSAERAKLSEGINLKTAKKENLPAVITQTLALSNGKISEDQLRQIFTRKDLPGEVIPRLLFISANLGDAAFDPRVTRHLSPLLEKKSEYLLETVRALVSRPGLIARSEWARAVIEAGTASNNDAVLDAVGQFVKDSTMYAKPAVPENLDFAMKLLLESPLIDRSTALAKVPAPFWTKSALAPSLLQHAFRDDRSYIKDAAAHLDDNIIRKVFAVDGLPFTDEENWNLFKKFISRKRDNPKAEVAVFVSLAENMLTKCEHMTLEQAAEAIELIALTHVKSGKFTNDVHKALWKALKAEAFWQQFKNKPTANELRALLDKAYAQSRGKAAPDHEKEAEEAKKKAEEEREKYEEVIRSLSRDL